ncbi:MAG: DUF2796 domain-containing protein [Candidatus Thiodiazotropha sp. (ex Notomyrtea botanica)]|nr:DUF2796 domain-containing protein [Candidatus Thiodiazotropha sp. (ex Notomyrtea botanica)]
MTITKQGTIILSISLLASLNQLYAAESDHEQHEAHVHGEAKLLVALEGNTLEVEFLSPAMNIVGFEHKPTKESQIHAVESAIMTLKQPNKLFGISSDAGCKPGSIEVESPLAGHDEHNHSDEAHNDEQEGEHSDFTGHYHFLCTDTSQLKSIEITIFKQFPGTEVIEVQSISKQGQQKIDLTPGKNILQL